MNMHLLRAGLAAATVIPLGVAVTAALPQIASATDITISWSDGCTAPDSGVIGMTAHLVNTYSQPLTVRISDPASPYNHTLAPGEHYNPSYTTTTAHAAGHAVMSVTATNGGVLIGDTSHTISWVQGQCTPAPTTVPAPTTTTICSAAVPPRQDCPPPFTVPTEPPTVLPTTVVPPPDSTAPPVSSPVTPAVTVPATTVKRASSSTTVAIFLPTTGSSDTEWMVGIAAGLMACGIILLLVRRRGAAQQ
jgi:LPXTG-motif cell wall-anchored protein